MDDKEHAQATLAMLYSQARAQFGRAVKSYWFCDGDACPGCLRAVDTLRYKGQDTLSLNAFMHRPRGVLIGYLLCSRCARRILRAAHSHTKEKTPLHEVIEQRLVQGYEQYLRSLDA